MENMRFEDFKYERPDFDKLRPEFEALIEEFKMASSFQEQNQKYKEINKRKAYLSTMANLVFIRHSIDTKDEFYETEQNFLDEALPSFGDVDMNLNIALSEAKFKDELMAEWGEQLFTLAEIDLKTFSEDIIPDLIEENKIVSEYSKLVASAQIDFEGSLRTLPQMTPFMQSKDRDMRKRANEAHSGFFIENEDKFDDIYDRLVKVRTRIAKKLGYENFVELGYYRMGRSDYGKDEVKNYREQVYRELVPLVNELKDRQRERLGLDKLYYYDESLQFLSGNPDPKGDSEWIVANGKKMYEELSKETSEFFNMMLERNLLDLLSKEGKMSGGYCTFIEDYRAPFIFANFNGTRGDVDVLTHEAGHAFQTYMSMDLGVPEYGFPTSEAAEIHSMSMEFITWPWMDLFFEEDSDKYRFVHMAGALSFIPYGVTVDEFQHFVYENPDASPQERKAKWREIEKKYLPKRDYEENEFLENGGFWFRQGHIFESPFYYIDYTLAQVCAFQFWIRFNENREEAWEDYLRLCKAGGSKPFLELLELAGLENPFIDGTIKKTVGPIKEYLDGVDDSKF